MRKIYGNISTHRDFPTSTIILHLQDLATVGGENIELSSPGEIMELVNGRNVTAIHFYLFGLPRRPVAVEKAAKHIKKLFA